MYKEESQNMAIHFDQSVIDSHSSLDLIKSVKDSKVHSLIVVPSDHCLYEISSILTHMDESTSVATIKENDDMLSIFEKITAKEGFQNGSELNVVVMKAKEFYRFVATTPKKCMGIWSLYLYGKIDLYSIYLLNIYNKEIAQEIVGNFDTHGSVIPNISHINKVSVSKKIKNKTSQSKYWQKKRFKEFLESVNTDALDVLIADKDYKKAVDISNEVYNKSGAKIAALSFVKPEILTAFKSVLVRQPFFEKSIAYQLMKNLGIALKPSKLNAEAGSVHANGSNLNIFYVTEGLNSKNYKEKKTGDDSEEDYEELMVKAFAKDIGNNKFLFLANEASIQKHVYRKFQSNTLNPEDGQGVLVNRDTCLYGQYSHAIYTYSNYLYESERSLLITCGIEADVIDYDSNFLTCYELLSMTVLKYQHNDREVYVYFVDEETSEQVKSVYPGAKITKLPVPKVEPEKKKISKMPMSYNDYKSYQRVNKRYKEGERQFSRKTAMRYIDYCETGGHHLKDGNSVYEFIKDKYG